MDEDDDLQALLPDTPSVNNADEKVVYDPSSKGLLSKEETVQRTTGEWMRLHLLLLVWKNGVMQKRRPIWTTVEISLPILAIIVLAVLKLLTKHADTAVNCVRPVPADADSRATYLDDCQWDPFPVNVPQASQPASQCTNGAWDIGYTPHGGVYDIIMQEAQQHMSMNLNGGPGSENVSINLFPFDSEDAMISDPRLQVTENQKCIAGIVFDTLDLGNRKVSYKVRLDSVPGGFLNSSQYGILAEQHNSGSWFTERSFPAAVLFLGPRLSSALDAMPLGLEQPDGLQQFNAYGSQPGYPEYTFLPMQASVNQAITRCVHFILNVYA